MKTFTVLVQHISRRGTKHVSAHEAESLEDAKQQALEETCADWGQPPAYVTMLRVQGVLEGDVQVLEFDDDEE